MRSPRWWPDAVIVNDRDGAEDALIQRNSKEAAVTAQHPPFQIRSV
jgi:hypothetical protein